MRVADDAPHIVFLGDVLALVVDVVAEALGQRRSLRLGTAGDHDGGPMVREEFGGRRADSTRAAGDDGDPILKRSPMVVRCPKANDHYSAVADCGRAWRRFGLRVRACLLEAASR